MHIKWSNTAEILEYTIPDILDTYFSITVLSIAMFML